MATTRRIVCYAVNGSGLGHVTRLIAVGRWLRRYVSLLEGKQPEIFFLTSGEASDALARAGFASFKIPSKSVVRAAGIDPLEYRRLAKQLVWQTLGLFAPDLLVVDTFPSGSFDELFQLLDGPFKKSFIFRDVKPEYAARPIFSAALGLYDTVVVPGAPAEAGAEPGEAAARVGLCAPGREVAHAGVVLQVEREELPPAEQVRRELGLGPEQRLIYLSAGGGGDPSSEETLTAMVEALRLEQDLHLLVGAGPLYRGRRLGGPRLTWFTDPGVVRYLAACDAAVSAGGYNTFNELLFLRVPSLFYVQEKVADDQARRIEQAQDLGACRLIAPPARGGGVLEQLRQVLHPERREAMRAACAEVIPDNGARRCARLLLRPLYAPARLAWASALLPPRLACAFERVVPEPARALGRLLPRLLPEGQAEALADLPALDAVVGQLSSQARDELTRALEQRPEARERGALAEALTALLSAAERVGCPADAVLSALEVSMKKHPLNQQGERRWATWITALVLGLGRVVELEVPGLTSAEVLQLYRVFPRLVDADVERAMETFITVVRARAALGEQTHEVMQQLQVIKLTHRRITCELVAPLLSGAGGAP